MVDLHTNRYLVEPEGSPRGFEATALVLEGKTRFDMFPSHCELYRIDLLAGDTSWLDCPVTDYA